MLPEEINEQFEKIASAINEYGGNFIPVVKELTTHIRLNRFDKRIKENEQDIKKILRLIDKNDFEFFTEKIGVMVFEKILNDQQDEKVEFLLLGFENCVKNDIKDEDKILYYFDMISELRVIDVKRLVTLARMGNTYPLIEVAGSDGEFLLRNVDLKLMRLNLIHEPVNVLGNSNLTRTDLKNINVTKLGNSFLDFLGYNR